MLRLVQSAPARKCVILNILFVIVLSDRSSWAFSNLQKLGVGQLYTQQRQSVRPWLEFFNTSQFKPPANLKAGTIDSTIKSNAPKFFS